MLLQQMNIILVLRVTAVSASASVTTTHVWWSGVLV
jgi:hypothetical protein